MPDSRGLRSSTILSNLRAHPESWPLLALGLLFSIPVVGVGTKIAKETIHELSNITHAGDIPNWPQGHTLKCYVGSPDMAEYDILPQHIKKGKPDCVGLSADTKGDFEKAFRIVESLTNLSFVLVEDVKDAEVAFLEGTPGFRSLGVTSGLGMQQEDDTPLKSVVIINRDKRKFFPYGTNYREETVFHELMHVLGMYHRSFEPSLLNTFVAEREKLTTSDIAWLQHNYPPGPEKPSPNAGIEAVGIKGDEVKR